LGDAALLICTTGVATTCSTFDFAAIGLGGSTVQLRRNLTASVIRIAALVGVTALGTKSGEVILASWTVGFVGSLLVCPLRRYLPPRRPIGLRQCSELIRCYWSVALGHHGLTLAISSSSLLLPVVVGSIMTASQVAYFAQARLLADAILAVGGLALSGSAIVGAALLGHFPLLMFGANYSEKSFPLLLLLVAVGPAWVLKDHFVVLRRLQGKRLEGALTVAAWTVLELSGAVIGGLASDMTMLCWGWFALSTFCGLTALPTIVRAVRTPRSRASVDRAPNPDDKRE
jgi:hypothetical protein